MQSMGVKYVEAFGDSLLVVQQVSMVCQYYNGALNAYLDRCLDIISCFDESDCDDGQGIGAILISLNGIIFEFSNRLEEECTNNQDEYEALLFGLEFLESMGVKLVEAYDDSLLVVQ